MIPEWMKEVNVGPCNCSAVYHGKKSFIGRTIGEIFEFIEAAFVTESYSRRKGQSTGSYGDDRINQAQRPSATYSECG